MGDYIQELEKLCPSPGSGPLDKFRCKDEDIPLSRSKDWKLSPRENIKPSFDWRQLRILIHRKDLLETKMKIWNLLEKDPVFHRGEGELGLDEYRSITARRLHRFMELDPVPDSEIMASPLKSPALVSALGMYDWSLCAKKMLHREFFMSSISGAGTGRHKTLLKDSRDNRIGGAFCLTEISHGTNTKGLGTTATYDLESGKFILNTPSFLAAKCWAGNLAKTASHASVFAQLITPDGKCHGLHNFLVPVRDPVSHIPYPGVIIGDMGSKIGLNGLDNGWLKFNNYQIDREMLLNKTGDVLPTGEYTTPFKDPNKRFGASLGNLSGGRVGIVNMATTNLHLAIVIAVRYSAVRKQFGPAGEEEWPVLFYQTQYRRLMPHLAACFALHHFSLSLYEDFVRLLLGRMTGEDEGMLADLGMEIHGLSSAAKPLASWTAQRAVQEAREACGGHGYLSAARFGKIRDDNDANCTYEGDNNVLLQQTSNWILNLVNRNTNTPAGTLSWLQDFQKNTSLSETELNSDFALHATRCLLLSLIKTTQEELSKLKLEGSDKFLVRGNSQFHLARTLSLVYIQAVVIQRFTEYTRDNLEFSVLNLLCDLYSLWVVEELGSDLLIHGVISGSCLSKVRTKVLQLSRELVPEAIALTDVLAPPDFIIQSILGQSSGKVYELMEQSFYSTPGSFSTPDFAQLYTNNYRAKL